MPIPLCESPCEFSCPDGSYHNQESYFLGQPMPLNGCCGNNVQDTCLSDPPVGISQNPNKGGKKFRKQSGNMRGAIGGKSPCKCKTTVTNISDESTVVRYGKKVCGNHCCGECEEASSTSSQKFSNFTSGRTGNRWFNAEGDGVLLEEEEPNDDVDGDAGVSTAPTMKAMPSIQDTGQNMLSNEFRSLEDVSLFQPLAPENNPNHADFDPSLEGSKDNLGRVRRSNSEWDEINRQSASSSGDMMAQGVNIKGLGRSLGRNTSTTSYNDKQGKSSPIVINQAGQGQMSMLVIGGLVLIAVVILIRKDK